MIQKIINAYDSHTHFLATGQVESGLKLDFLNSVNDISKIKIQDGYFQADWLVGFGWNDQLWTNNEGPNLKTIDLIFQNVPVLFSRTDGHASWINSLGLKLLIEKGFNLNLYLSKGLVGLDSLNQFNGVLKEQAHIDALSRLPKFSDSQLRNFLQVSQTRFNKAGFTHIRDMSMTTKQWSLLLDLENKKEIKVFIDSYLTIESVNDIEKSFTEIKEMRSFRTNFFKVLGVKIFVDGSLGSKTAYLSENYVESDFKGHFFWTKEDIKYVLLSAWKNQLEVAVHVIGDQAAHDVISVAREVSAQGVLGRLNLEHVEILNDETIQLMKPLHVTCHLQPQHWLSDKKWIDKILSKNLQKNLFQWEKLRKNKIPFYFGSDSPIEKPSLLNTPIALLDSEKNGILKLNEDWRKYHTYPQKKLSDCYTEFDLNEIKQVYFLNEPIL